MIVLFTDFGLSGPYLGQVRAVLYQHAPQTPVIDLFADVPVHDPQAAAYLLANYAEGFPPESVFLAVVDPGVGTTQRETVIVRASKHWFVGPDNGLFNVVAARYQNVQAWHVSWRPKKLSASFHGRDIFAPIAGDLAAGRLPADEYLEPVKLESWDDELMQVIYVDHFGNLITGLRASSIGPEQGLFIGGTGVPRVRTFADVPHGSPLCYENANGLMEVAVNQGRAETYFGAAVGSLVTLSLSC